MFEHYVSRKNLPLLLGCVIFLFAFLIYRNTVPNGYTLDDAIYNSENKLVQQGIKGIPVIFVKSTYFGYNGSNDQIYRPLPVACFAIEHSLYGNNPHFNHLINVLIYALCCSLLFFLLRRLFTGKSTAISFCITLLFTAHPIHTEAVASIKGLDEILAFLFSVLTLYCVLCHSDRKNIFALAAGLLSYFLCLLSKEHGLTLLGILPVTLFTFRTLPLKRIVMLTLPFCLVALFYIVFRSRILDYFTFREPLQFINNALLATDNRADRLATAFVILGKYLRLLFIPYPLCWDYSYNQIPVTTWADPKAFMSLIVYLFILIVGIAGVYKKKPTAFGMLFFLLSFSISTNLFIKIGVTLGERLLFTPSLGFCIAIVMLAANSAQRLKYRKPLLSAAMVAVIALYAFITVNRNLDWKDNFMLISRDIVKNPASFRAHSYLGSACQELRYLEKYPHKDSMLLSRAIAEYQKGLAIYPRDWDSWFYLGNAYSEADRKESAIEAYKRAVSLKPNNTKTLNNIGATYLKMKNYDSAECYFHRVLAINKYFVAAYLNLASIDQALNNYGAALGWYKKVVEFDPRNKAALLNMSALYRMSKDTALARQFLEAAK
ncbi:MAG: tetratricopeptide repeat protein [Chitinispirillaceae bacterium]